MSKLNFELIVAKLATATLRGFKTLEGLAPLRLYVRVDFIERLVIYLVIDEQAEALAIKAKF